MGVFQRIGREYELFMGLQRTLKAYEEVTSDPDLTVADVVERTVDRAPDALAIRFEGQDMSYGAFDARANRYAQWALAQGLKKGDAVSLFMTNQPDYIACWVGLSKIGVVTGLINTNLAGQPLAHTINISGARHIVLSSDLAEAYHGVADRLEQRPKAWALGPPVQGAADLGEALDQARAERPGKEARADLKREDLALFVYTSGTTGAPKAARMLHRRVLGMMRAFVGGGRATPKDRVYITLPLYHGTGGLCGVGFALTTGGAIILRRKFSASHFWEEAANEGATVFFYIGELCRYLVNQPPHPKERAHTLRLGVGNGLRPDVWDRFQQRFAIRRILEFYGSTEGNVSLMNFDGKAGAVGRLPGYLKKKVNVRIVKFDVEAEVPVRGGDGLCIEAGPDEVGEAVGEIREDDPRYKFEGYTGDAKQTEKKVLRDAFAKGDAWFRTGDLMRMDADGYIYFIDRIGDTFRWKGENVSTNEVAEVLTSGPGVTEANVYGVKIEGLDGRAGMASIQTAPGFDLAALRAFLAKELPAYARPLFIRLQGAIETTGTFKYRKVDLVQQGFDPAKSEDVTYFDHPEEKAYVPVTGELYAAIQAGRFRL